MGNSVGIEGADEAIRAVAADDAINLPAILKAHPKFPKEQDQVGPSWNLFSF